MDKEPNEADCQLHNDLSFELVQDILKAGLFKGQPEASILLLESVSVGVIGAVILSEKQWSKRRQINYAALIYDEICKEGLMRIFCWIMGKKYDPK